MTARGRTRMHPIWALNALMVLAALAVRVRAKSVLERLEVLALQRRPLAERRHVGPHVVDPDFSRVFFVLVPFTTPEE